MKFFSKKKKIDESIFIFEYLDVVYFDIKKEFDDFIKKTDVKNPTEDQFKEFVIFNLFIDYATFITCFTNKEAWLLLENLGANLLYKLMQNGNLPNLERFNFKEWGQKLEMRFNEYLPCLEEFTSEGFERWDVNKHFVGSELGKKFSRNFMGEKDPLVVYPATWLFLTRVGEIGKRLKLIKVNF